MAPRTGIDTAAAESRPSISSASRRRAPAHIACRSLLASRARVCRPQLDAFRLYYNTCRPHRALARQTPATAFNARIKARPAQPPAPIDHRVRRDKIDSSGKVTLCYLGRLRHIPVGAAHKHRKVRLLVAGADVRIVTEDGELIRALTLDPTRDYQPLGGRWPVYHVPQQVSTMS